MAQFDKILEPPVLKKRWMQEANRIRPCMSSPWSRKRLARKAAERCWPSQVHTRRDKRAVSRAWESVRFDDALREHCE